MIYIQEFEFYESEGVVLTIPFGLEGGTFGDDLKDAVQSASDWLYETVMDDLVHGKAPAWGSIGNEPRCGGRVIAVSVNCDLEKADAVTAADAARMLGVSSARVAQMCDSGQLTSWKQGTRRMVMRESVKARMNDDPKPGRPKKAAMA